MNIEEKLSIITPARFGAPMDIINFIMSITSLYVVLGRDRPVHFISPCDYRGLKVGPGLAQRHKDALMNGYSLDYSKAKKCLEQYGAIWKEVAPMSTPVKALMACLKNITTEYVYVHLADVGFINGKNVFEPCIRVMDEHPRICQTRIGGYPFSNQRKNTDIVSRDGLNIYFSNDKGHLLEGYPADNYDVAEDVVWVISMKAECQKNFYPVPLWNCVMRASFLRKVAEQALAIASEEPITLTNLVSIINGAPDLVRYNLPQVGWREEFKWIEELEQGVLNMACYQYAWGREENPPAWFAKNNTIEVI